MLNIDADTAALRFMRANRTTSVGRWPHPPVLYAGPAEHRLEPETDPHLGRTCHRHNQVDWYRFVPSSTCTNVKVLKVQSNDVRESISWYN